MNLIHKSIFPSLFCTVSRFGDLSSNSNLQRRMKFTLSNVLLLLHRIAKKNKSRRNYRLRLSIISHWGLSTPFFILFFFFSGWLHRDAIKKNRKEKCFSSRVPSKNLKNGSKRKATEKRKMILEKELVCAPFARKRISGVRYSRNEIRWSVICAIFHFQIGCETLSKTTCAKVYNFYTH